MSSRSWTESGIGFPIFTGDNCYNVLEFFKNHEDSFKAVFGEKTHKEVFCALDQLEEAAEIDGEMDEEIMCEGFDDIFDYNTADFIASIINYECGIKGIQGFQSDGDCGTEETVMYTAGFPWQMSDKEKNLTSEMIEDILKKYAKELAIPEEEIGDQLLEYYG